MDAVLTIAHRLAELTADAANLKAAREIFQITNVRLFLEFHPVQVKNRTLNKIKGGVVTFGDAPPPIAVYEGPTSRRQIKG